jgi:hypothetical protein
MTSPAYIYPSEINRIQQVFAIQDTITLDAGLFLDLNWHFLCLFDSLQSGHGLRTLHTHGVAGLSIHCHFEGAIDGRFTLAAAYHHIEDMLVDLDDHLIHFSLDIDQVLYFGQTGSIDEVVVFELDGGTERRTVAVDATVGVAHHLYFLNGVMKE